MNLEKEPSEREIWEQLDGESDRAYGAWNDSPKKTAFDEAFDEILDTEAELHNAYLRVITEALKRSRTMGR
jgi:hypothetical protein